MSETATAPKHLNTRIAPPDIGFRAMLEDELHAAHLNQPPFTLGNGDSLRRYAVTIEELE